MPVTVGFSSISGIATATEGNDVAYKTYTDNLFNRNINFSPPAGGSGRFLITPDGSTTTWDYSSNYQEFTTPGAQTYTVPDQANMLFIEAVGAGAGGGGGVDKPGKYWVIRTTTVDPLTGYNIQDEIQELFYRNNVYVGMGVSNPFGSGVLSIYASTTGEVWTLRTQPRNGPLYPGSPGGISYGLNLYCTVAIGYNNSHPIIMSSTDTIVWTLRTMIPLNPFPISFGDTVGTNLIFDSNTNTFFSGSYVVALGMQSTDGMIWVMRSTGNTGLSVTEDLVSGNGIIVGGGQGIVTSPDGINWTLRTIPTPSGTVIGSTKLAYNSNLYVYVQSDIKYATSTNAIVWTLRTTPVIQDYGPARCIYADGNFWLLTASEIYQDAILMGSTNAIQWSIRTVQVNQTAGFSTSLRYHDIVFGNSKFIISGSTREYNTPSTRSRILVSKVSGGGGGASGSYTNWYIPKSLISSNITVNPGVGGKQSEFLGFAGAATTISWTGPDGQTYSLVSLGASCPVCPGAAQTVISSFNYTTAGLNPPVAGLNSGEYVVYSGAGTTAEAAVNSFQSTGGGSGAASTSQTGGFGGQLLAYGNTYQASGGTSVSVNGVSGIAITGSPVGYGGGGGGSSAIAAGKGGNGARGSGGGGGASIGSSVGHGGTGGDGYVKISWW